MATTQTSIDDLESHEADALTHLEERIQKTIALVSRLREERDAAAEELATVKTELASLRAEKTQVRNRLEKLLGQIDQLGPA